MAKLKLGAVADGEAVSLDVTEAKKEITEARITGQTRAAIGSIVRRHVEEIKNMSPKGRYMFLHDLDVTPSYYTELTKEIALFKYNQEKGVE